MGLILFGEIRMMRDFLSIDSEVSLEKGDSLHIRIDEKGSNGQTSVGFEFGRLR